MMPNAIMNK